MTTETKDREEAEPLPYGPVRSPGSLGRLVRLERRRQGLTLDEMYSTSGLTTRFLSEFERGKPNASLGRVMAALQALGLEMLVVPRGEAERLLAIRRAQDARKAPGKEGP